MSYYMHPQVLINNGTSEHPDGSIVICDLAELQSAIIVAILSTFSVLTPEWLSFIRKCGKYSVGGLSELLNKVTTDDILNAESGEYDKLKEITQLLQQVYFSGEYDTDKWLIAYNPNSKMFYCQHVYSVVSPKLEFDELDQIPFMV